MKIIKVIGARPHLTILYFITVILQYKLIMDTPIKKGMSIKHISSI
jgi:hypothetical protein